MLSINFGQLINMFNSLFPSTAQYGGTCKRRLSMQLPESNETGYVASPSSASESKASSTPEHVSGVEDDDLSTKPEDCFQEIFNSWVSPTLPTNVTNRSNTKRLKRSREPCIYFIRRDIQIQE